MIKAKLFFPFLPPLPHINTSPDKIYLLIKSAHLVLLMVTCKPEWPHGTGSWRQLLIYCSGQNCQVENCQSWRACWKWRHYLGPCKSDVCSWAGPPWGGSQLGDWNPSLNHSASQERQEDSISFGSQTCFACEPLVTNDFSARWNEVFTGMEKNLKRRRDFFFLFPSPHYMHFITADFLGCMPNISHLKEN